MPDGRQPVPQWSVHVGSRLSSRAIPRQEHSQGHSFSQGQSLSKMVSSVNDIFSEIIACKREEIDRRKIEKPMATWEAELDSAPEMRKFVAALQNAPCGIGLIAEVKKASPSAGLIRENFSPVEIAETYGNHGASCLSVLTDNRFFQGCLDDLIAVRNAVDLPLLRKDFILEHYQILEARCCGADCILLIAECLEPKQLRHLHHYALELGMETLIELYREDNLENVLQCHPTIIGINNRNLKTFETNLDHTLRMIEKIPNDVTLVSESGIRTRDEVVQLQQAGVQAILVGETLMRAENIGVKVDELLGKR